MSSSKKKTQQWIQGDRPFATPLFQQEIFESDLRLRWESFLKVSPPATYPSVSLSKRILTEIPQDIGRQFVVVKYCFQQGEASRYQLFYRSSGANSQTPHVWFPCDGLVLNYNQGLIYAKLTETKFNKKLRSQESFLKKMAHLGLKGMETPEKVMEGAVGRFGTPFFVYISYLLGGDGFWTNEDVRQLLGTYVKMDLSMPRQEYSLDRHIVRPIVSYEDVNTFARFAVSINYLLDEYDHSFPGLFDYETIYHKKILVGASRKSLLQCLLFLFIEYKDNKIVPIEVLYYWDIEKIPCTTIENYLIHLSRLVRSGKIFIQ